MEKLQVRAWFFFKDEPKRLIEKRIEIDGDPPKAGEEFFPPGLSLPDGSAVKLIVKDRYKHSVKVRERSYSRTDPLWIIYMSPPASKARETFEALEKAGWSEYKREEA